ncbi:uncharacterized protein LOC124913923 isoform X2 [Impatiens glandulifera]|uniref:uncharacterized protein LOC124913923 isoform X2 n=1 Tax=Impatiens glandulifera TaxID=253017 RepID=UPI001FB054FD|nr:uncharacterized protein LOC124913923 isoform X2 [Impatiens glandulifera]
MSGVPGKRPHEDVGGGGGGSNSSGSSKYPHDDSAAGYPNIGPKLQPSAGSSEYIHHHTNSHSHPQPMDHTPSPDPRVLPKIPRSESADKRQTLFQGYPRLSSSTNDYQHPDHPVAAFGENNKLDSRENIYNRDPKSENRESGREIRGDDGKDLKFEREPYQSEQHKGENVKLDKEGFGSGGNHLHLKESKEHHRIKRYADTPSVNAEMWNASRSNMHGPVERDVGKDALAEQRNPTEVHEAVGENKVDFKGEDRLKEKDRKRKEFKHRDWGERDRDRSDHRINLQISSGGSGETKESLKEDREGEKWEREKKDSAAKDKEKLKEREKDHPIKRETSNGADKDGLQSEKESVDAVGKPPEVESAGTDTKRLREHDSWKTNEKETRERKKERETDLEGERPEKRSRYTDKESDDGCPDAEAAGSEKDNHGGQQRRRMLRPRGSPQGSNRDQRVSSRTQENDGSQGKSDVSIVTYRVGECMQELLKLWKEYEATQDKSGENSQNGPTLEIRIPAEHVSATNRQVRGGQLWGTDVYTNDSDLVAVLMHTGYCRPTTSAPPSAVQELRATIRVLPPRDCYISTLRNNVRSRAWGAGISCSYRVELCCILKRGGGTIELEPCLTQTSTVEPTLAPVAVERTMTTRAAASNALRQQRFVREVTIQYNLCNEPWIKYSISVVADKGLKKALYTSARLKKGEVLYLETHTRRYELCFMGEKTVKSQTHDSEQNHGGVHTTNGERGSDGVDTISIDVFRWSRCKRPLPQKVMQSHGIPLPLEHVEVLEENLDWEDIQWSQTGVFLAGKEYLLARAHFISP